MVPKNYLLETCTKEIRTTRGVCWDISHKRKLGRGGPKKYLIEDWYQRDQDDERSLLSYTPQKKYGKFYTFFYFHFFLNQLIITTVAEFPNSQFCKLSMNFATRSVETKV